MRKRKASARGERWRLMVHWGEGARCLGFGGGRVRGMYALSAEKRLRQIVGTRTRDMKSPLNRGIASRGQYRQGPVASA